MIILERHQGVPWCYGQLDRIVTRLLVIPSYLGAAGLSIFFSCLVGVDGDCISAHVPDWAVHGFMAHQDKARRSEGVHLVRRSLALQSEGELRGLVGLLCFQSR